MRSITMRAGDCFTVGRATVQVNRTCDDRVRLSVDATEKISVMHCAEAKHDERELQDQLRNLAQEIVSEISETAPSHSKELLGVFVSELFLSVADQERREQRRQKQAEGIAAAKARGVRFGPSRKPLPEGFHEYYEACQSGKMTVTEAAEACGISRTAFYRAIARVEEGEQCVV